MNTVPFPKLEDLMESEPLEPYGTGTVCLDSSPDHHYQSAGQSDGSPTRQARINRFNASEKDYGKVLFDLIRPRTEMGQIGRNRTQSSSTSDDSQSVNSELERQRCEQSTHIKSLQKDIRDPGWCELRAATEEDRQRVKALRETIARSPILFDKTSNLLTIKYEELQGPFQQHLGEYERRRRRVQELADEMQYKWEHGGEFRGATMTKSQAESQASRVKAIGHMMMMVSMQNDCRDGSFHLGSRPYTQAPEYAIERSVGIDREGTTSLFEQDGHAGRAAPPRLARDPRFRAQLSEGIKIRGDEERIPRMFVARSRMQS